MNWKQATLSQLMEICYNDTGAPILFRLEAGEELKRRARQKYGRLNYKEKEVLPK